MTRPKGSADSAETDAASESRESLLSLPSRKEEKPAGLNLQRRNWRQGLTGASRPDINRERSATERFRSASLWLAVWSATEHRLTQSRVPGRAALRGWGLAPHPFKDG